MIMNEHQINEIDKPKVQWLSMSSKFAGICVNCNEVINQGESILGIKKMVQSIKTVLLFLLQLFNHKNLQFGLILKNIRIKNCKV